MAVYLKAVAGLVILFGVISGARFVSLVRSDEAYEKAALMKERNAGNILFESEFRVAEAGHIFLLYSAVSCFGTALIGGSLLLGLGALHSKIDGAVGERRS